MKLLIFSFDYPPHLGGISRLCGNISDQLEKTNEPPQVLTEYTYQKSEEPKENIKRITPKRFLREILSLFWLYRKWPKQAPILCGTWYPEGLLALLARRENVNILLHGTEILPTPSPIKEILWKPLKNWVLKRARLNIANSEYTAKLGEAVAPGARVTALPLAIDTSRFLQAKPKSSMGPFTKENPLQLLTVTRLQEYKGIDTILDALKMLTEEEREKIIYRIVGTGPYLARINDLILQNRLQNCVHVLGKTSEEELTDFYMNSHLFMMCSRLSLETQDVEGFGLVFLEAQACGTPVIGTRSGGIPSAVQHEQGGWLIEEDDSITLSQHIKQHLSSDTQLVEQSLKAYNKVREKNNLSEYVEKLSHLIHRGKS